MDSRDDSPYAANIETPHTFNFKLFRMWYSSGRRETVLSSYVSFVCYS